MSIESEALKIEDLKTKIADAINNSDLSPSVIKLVIDGVAKEVTALASQELVADIKKLKSEQEEEDRGMVADIQQKAKARYSAKSKS